MENRIITTIWPAINTPEETAVEKIFFHNIDKSINYLESAYKEFSGKDLSIKALKARDADEKGGTIIGDLYVLAKDWVTRTSEKMNGRSGAPYHKFSSYRTDNEGRPLLDVFDDKIPKKRSRYLQYDDNHDNKDAKPFYTKSIEMEQDRDQIVIYDPKFIDFLKKKISPEDIKIVSNHDYYEHMLQSRGQDQEWQKWVREDSRMKEDPNIHLKK